MLLLILAAIWEFHREAWEFQKTPLLFISLHDVTCLSHDLAQLSGLFNIGSLGLTTQICL